MLVGVPKEIKDNEYRVGMVPATAHELVTAGHKVLVETGAGLGAGLTDADPGMWRIGDDRAVGLSFEGEDEIFAAGRTASLDHAHRQLAAAGQNAELSPHVCPGAGRSPAPNRP